MSFQVSTRTMSLSLASESLRQFFYMVSFVEALVLLCLIPGLDPYALITCEGRTIRTLTISGTSDPEWNSGALFFVRRPKKTHLVVQVRSCMIDTVNWLRMDLNNQIF